MEGKAWICPISEGQYGFQKDRFAEHVLVVFRLCLEQSERNREAAIQLLLVDWRKFHDRLAGWLIIEVMLAVGVLVKWTNFVERLCGTRMVASKMAYGVSPTFPREVRAGAGLPMVVLALNPVAGGKKSIHFNGSDQNIELLFFTVIFANQLSVHGAIAGLCNEAPKDFRAPGKPAAPDRLEKMEVPTDLSVAENSTDAQQR